MTRASDPTSAALSLVRGESCGSPHGARHYWEERARRFATSGAGLRAVCSYGMPAFYNFGIHLTQRLALSEWLQVLPDMPVLDVGCGVGRWSLRMARRGARVTGIDLSPTMVSEARRRATDAGVADRCRFQVEDVTELDLGVQFPLILGVTVLQHILDESRLRRAIARLASHLEPGGRMVLLEAAPLRPTTRCDTAVFNARTADTYLEAFSRAGLCCGEISGVDPAPLKIWYLPYYRRLPRPLAVAGLAAVTAAALPIDALFGRGLASASWHKVFVLERAGL